MGLFFRKSLKLGPVRLNLGKSGVGASVGVKGLRVGTSARGRGYVSGGRGGVCTSGSRWASQAPGRASLPTSSSASWPSWVA